MSRNNAPSGLLPSWKNSPIKTDPCGLRRIAVTSQKPPIHKPSRVLGSAPATEQDTSKILRGVSSMFDDDGDQLEEAVIDDVLTPRISDEDAMRAMFASPNQSVNNSFNGTKPTAEYYWDREEVLEEDDNIQDEYYLADDFKKPDTSIHIESSKVARSDSPDLQSALREASQFAFEYARRSIEPIDLQLELTRNSFLLEHVQFLTNFDKEMTAHINNAQPASSGLPRFEDNIDHESELVTKLDHYMKLPQDALHAMVMRQHQEIVELGLFGND